MALTQQEALQELCDEQWPAVDQQVVAELELPGWETPDHLRQQVNQKFWDDPNVRNYDPRKSSDRYLLAQEFQRQALPTAKAAAQAVIYAVAHLDPRTLAAIRSRLRVKSIPKAPGKRPARLQNADARNLELLSFVVERIIPFGQLLDKRPDKHGKDVRLLPGHRGPKVAVPRQALAKEWNRSHSHNPMSSGDVLMGQFYRAVDRTHLCREFLQQVESESGAEWAEQKAALEELRESFARFSDAERAKLLAPIDAEAAIREWKASPKGKALSEKLQTLHRRRQDLHRRERERFSSEEDYQEWRAKRNAEREEEYRAGLTRKDLVIERVRRLVWRLPDEDSEAQKRLIQSPLRDWFLPEARGAPMHFHFWSRA